MIQKVISVTKQVDWVEREDCITIVTLVVEIGNTIRHFLEAVYAFVIQI